MKLNFLGQSYHSSNTQVETVASDMTARFLGQSYNIRRPVNNNFKSQLGLRKYRGVVYYK